MRSELIPLISLPPSIPKDNLNTYSVPLEDETALKRLLDQVLVTTVLVLVRELITVAPEVHKQLKDLSGKVYPSLH